MFFLFADDTTSAIPNATITHIQPSVAVLVFGRLQTIEFPDDELVEPLEGLDIAEDGIELPPPPAPEPEVDLAPIKPNLLVREDFLFG